MNSDNQHKQFWSEVTVATEKYKNFWIDYFSAYGFVTSPLVTGFNSDLYSACHFQMSFNGIEYIVSCHPFIYKGVKVYSKSSRHQLAKFWSETGARKFMRQNNVGNL